VTLSDSEKPLGLKEHEVDSVRDIIDLSPELADYPPFTNSYANGGIGVHLHIWIRNLAGRDRDFCAVFESSPGDVSEGPCHIRIAEVCGSVHFLLYDVKTPVLVSGVEPLQVSKPERLVGEVPSLVRLKPLDQCLLARTEHRNPSGRAAPEGGLLEIDRKQARTFVLGRKGVGVIEGKLEDKVVETATVVVDKLSNYEWPMAWKGLKTADLECVASVASVRLADDCIRVEFVKGLDLLVERFSVVVEVVPGVVELEWRSSLSNLP
jgi:hypothetical protein